MRGTIKAVETLTLVVTVHCLACGATYSKPQGRGTVKTNPGCPECGYLGWSLAEDDVTDDERLRFVEGLPRLLAARRR
jgi:predicted  nucleic acid-binding Zn-ribbon protein